MDVLSEILKSIKLEGAVFFNAELSSPWSVSEPHGSMIVPHLSPGSSHLILYHYVMSGVLDARLPEGPRQPLKPGDVVIFPHGDPHILSNGKPEKPVDAIKTFGKNLSDGLKLTRYGGGGEVTRLICGYMVCEPRLSDIILSGLPKMLTITLSDDASGRWLANSIEFSVGESRASGGENVTARLSELIFVETLRRYISTLSEGQVGWLAGSRDHAIGNALALMHASPASQWTISTLAREIGLSRTALADRFKYFLDDSPMAYLAKWRLRLGAESLLKTDDSVAEIAMSVGYASESTFNRAFKREYDVPPAQFRRSHRQTL